jgi:hypothetical protein
MGLINPYGDNHTLPSEWDKRKPEGLCAPSHLNPAVAQGPPELQGDIAGAIAAFVASMAPGRTPRSEVYAAIDGERDYQNGLARNEVKDQRPMEHLAIIRQIVRDAEAHWYYKSGQLPLDFMRKIAAVAVRCMEEHGAPRR